MAQTGAGVVAAASTLLSVLTSEPRCTRREQSLSLAEPGVILVWLALYLVNWLSLMKLKGTHDLDLNLHSTTWHPRSPSLCLQRLNSRLIYIQFPPGVPPWTPPRWLTLSPGPSLKPAPPRSPISSAGRGLARPEADRCTSSVTPGAHQSLTAMFRPLPPHHHNLPIYRPLQLTARPRLLEPPGKSPGLWPGSPVGPALFSARHTLIPPSLYEEPTLHERTPRPGPRPLGASTLPRFPLNVRSLMSASSITTSRKPSLLLCAQRVLHLVDALLPPPGNS